MAQERRELAVGLQLDADCARLTYFYPSMREPKTLGEGDGKDTDQIVLPPGVWEAISGEKANPELLREFFASSLEPVLKVADLSRLRIMVMEDELDERFTARVPQALEALGISRKHIYVQDLLSSFFYYAVNQRRDLWHSGVALILQKNEHLLGYFLHLDWTKAPALVTIDQKADLDIHRWGKNDSSDKEENAKKDRQLMEFLRTLFGAGEGITSYLVGEGFNRSWAPNSFTYLIQGRRHAFQGKNLFSQGACYAAMERAGMKRLPELLFLGKDIVKQNLGMNLRIHGKETYYPLVTAGVNWYEAHHECEIMADDEKSLTIWEKPMTGEDEVAHVLRLDHFPDRPPRTTRLHVDLYFISAGNCVVEVEDMGFGQMYVSSGRRWNRKIIFSSS